MAGSVLKFKDVKKIYPGEPPVVALGGVSFELPVGDFAALVGPSGSGKTTLLNLASGLDQASSGEIWLGDLDISKVAPSKLSEIRRDKLGFVFQSYNLFAVLSAVENVEYSSLIRGDSKKSARDKAIWALEQVGLAHKIHSLPNQLNGGQQQRVAVARALASDPLIIFADEPTANLDSKTALGLIDLFEELNVTQKRTFLFSTHDHRLVNRVKTQFAMKDGQLCL